MRADTKQVLCHSYGGTPTTEGLAGQNIKRIIYLTAIAPRVGQTHFEDLEVDKAMLPPVTVSMVLFALKEMNDYFHYTACLIGVSRLS